MSLLESRSQAGAPSVLARLRSAGMLLLLVLGVCAASLQAQGPPPLPNLDALLTQPATQSSFTFDRGMLQAADGFFANGDAETRRVVAGLNSITVHNYHFRDRADYDPAAFAAVADQFKAGGWQHLVNAGGRDRGTMTDLWLHLSGPNVTGVTVLNRGNHDMNYVAVDCTLRPLDLLHLSGHFGIPKIDPDAVMVPAH